jgi:hypothetical protein
MRPEIIRTDDNEFDALVVHTDFSDDAAWRVVTDLLNQPHGDDGEFDSTNQFIDDPAFAAASPDEVLLAAANDPLLSVLFLADAATMRGVHPLLAVSTLSREDYPDDEDYESALEFGREFRLLPAAVAETHANLAIANMDFEEFAASAADDPERIHRGFLAPTDAAPTPDVP